MIILNVIKNKKLLWNIIIKKGKKDEKKFNKSAWIDTNHSNEF
mgnify:CR=1 FL=1